ncbi:MAG: protein kinase domain-containing protein [Thermoanaerobaculia bacterium]
MTLAAGTRVGRYEILAPIGHGGMSDVYRARDVRLDRDVALKVLAQRLAGDPVSLQRFEREAKAVAALTHPNILAIHDYGSESGLHFSATELLEGETLRSRLIRGHVPWRRAIEIGAAIAEGLAVAHAKGIVHRDLKPENVFLMDDGRVKILDFGIAQLRQSEQASVDTGSDTPTVPLNTREGSILGTAGYMSPEQLRAEDTGPTSDIFSFGCVLYEMITGRPAFQRATLVDTLSAVLTEEPGRAAELVEEIPAELDILIGRCLEKQPGARFQSASDLAFALRALATTSTPHVVPAGRRNGRLLLMVLALAALIPAISGYFVYRGFRATRMAPPGGPRISSLAIIPFTDTGGAESAYLGDGMTEGLINRVAQLPGLRVMSRTTVFHYKGKEVDPRQIGRDLEVDAVLAGRIRRIGDSLRVDAELIDARDGSQIWSFESGGAPSDIAALEERLARELTDKLEIRLSGQHRERLVRRDTESALAYDHYLRGRYQWNKRSAEGLFAAIDYFNRAIEADPNFALAYAGLADCYNLLDIWAGLPTRETFPKAKAAAEKALALDEQLAEAHTSLAYAIQTYEWDWKRAESEYRRALELNPNYATARQWYAELLTANGRYDEARREGEAALKLDPLSPIIHAVIGWNECMARSYDDSIERNQETVRLFPGFMPGHAYLGLAYLESGRPRAAMEALDDALAIADIPVVRTWYLRALAAEGDSDAARRALAALEAEQRSKYLSPYYVGALRAALGDRDAALKLLEAALAERAGACVWIKVDPALDALRDDPRFLRLQAQVFPPEGDAAGSARVP